MSLESMEKAISEEVNRCTLDLCDIAEDSQRDYRLSLKPGDRIAEYGPLDILTDEGRAEKSARLKSATANINAIIDAERANLETLMTEPATADEVATVSLALSREGITEEELRVLYKRYMGNYQLAIAIEGCAKSHGWIIKSVWPAGDVATAKLVANRLKSRYEGDSVVSDTGAAFFASTVSAAFSNGMDQQLDTLNVPNMPSKGDNYISLGLI